MDANERKQKAHLCNKREEKHRKRSLIESKSKKKNAVPTHVGGRGMFDECWSLFLPLNINKLLAAVPTAHTSDINFGDSGTFLYRRMN